MFINFCATGKSGLGHIRRITNIAVELRRQRPGFKLRLICNANLVGVQNSERALYQEILQVDRNSMVTRMPDGAAIVVDTAVLPGLESCKQPLCLILRQTRVSQVASFSLGKKRSWDLVLAPNPPAVWTPDYAALPRRKTIHVGWIYRTADSVESGAASSFRRIRRVLIASGGGGSHGKALGRKLALLIDEIRANLSLPLEVVQCIGPRADIDSRIRGVDVEIRPGADLPNAFAAADLVITTAGYNSVLELATLDVPTLLLPIETRYDDQQQRTNQWSGSLGFQYAADNFKASVEWTVQTLLLRRRREPIDIGPSGAGKAAASIIRLATKAPKMHHA